MRMRSSHHSYYYLMQQVIPHFRMTFLSSINYLYIPFQYMESEITHITLKFITTGKQKKKKGNEKEKSGST